MQTSYGTLKKDMEELETTRSQAPITQCDFNRPREKFHHFFKKHLDRGKLDAIVKLRNHPNVNGIKKKSPSQSREITKTFKTNPKKPTHIDHNEHRNVLQRKALEVRLFRELKNTFADWVLKTCFFFIVGRATHC